MSNTIRYKEFIGSVNYDDDGGYLYGKIEAIDDLITYEANDVQGLKAAFREAVEDYILLCNEAGKEPGKSYKGSFNVRFPQELHQKAAVKAAQKGISLNQLVKEAVEEYTR
jgi:predicted HicB family RNase H-like nuclease